MWEEKKNVLGTFGFLLTENHSEDKNSPSTVPVNLLCEHVSPGHLLASTAHKQLHKTMQVKESTEKLSVTQQGRLTEMWALLYWPSTV